MTKALKDNLAKLEEYLIEEQKSANPSQIYIEDLELSIKAAKRQIGFFEKNPKGYEEIKQ